MTDGSSRKSRLVDYVEEEMKVRKNLGRLIHTVQHMPTARYRRDASSLWNWVGELESFQPPSSQKSENCSKKTGRKSFSRKYLDLRLYPSRDKSSSPECNLKSQQQPEMVKKNKNTETKKKCIYTNQNVEPNFNTSQDKRSFNKTKYDRDKICKTNVLSENETGTKNSTTEVLINSEIKGSYLKPQGKLQRFQLRKKAEGTNMSKQNNSSQQFHRDKKRSFPSKQEINSLESYKCCKNIPLDKMKGLKNSVYIKDRSNSSKQLHRTLDKTISNENYWKKDQTSMVKTLTTYWNNLLNNENDDNEGSSSHESSDVPLINKNLQDLARSIYHNASDRRRRIPLPHHKSESTEHLLRNVDNVNVRPDVFNNHEENKDDFFECLSEILAKGDVSQNKRKKGLLSKIESLSDEQSHSTNLQLLEMCYDKSCGDNQNPKPIHYCKVEETVEPNFDFKAKHAIEVLEKLVRKLRRFCELSLTSDQISLSHPLRTMLCLITATVFSSEKDVLDDYLEPEVVAEVTSGEDVANEVNLRVSSECAEISGTSLTERLNHVAKCNNNGKNYDFQLVAVQGITMRKVEEALRYLAVCKDYLWTEFLLSPRFNEEFLYNHDSHNHSPQSFTFVIEEELLFGEDCNEENNFYEYESEDEEEESNMEEVYKSVYDSFLISLERVTDLAADMFVNNWPGSFEEFVRTMYQALVSLLVWWVIAKEIFCK